MKLIVLHGDDLDKVSARLTTFVNSAKKRGWDIKRIDSEAKLTLPESVTAGELFQKNKLFLVSNPAKLAKGDTDWLKEKSKDFGGNIVIYQEGTIPKTVFTNLPKPDKVEEYKLPKTIFTFLEAFYPGNSKSTIKLLHEINEPPEFVLALLSRHLRDLFIIKSKGKLPYPSWRTGKLEAQSSKFSRDLLKEIINNLALIDVESKTSRQDLLALLDLLVLTKLE